MCHTLNQFCSPLPPTYSDFKEMCSSILPNIVDTKVRALIASTGSFLHIRESFEIFAN